MGPGRGRAERLDRDGRLWLKGALRGAALAAFDRACGVGARPGRRLALAGPLARALAPGSPLPPLVAEFLPAAKPVRVVSFDKSADRNWAVPWHQDRVIQVSERHAVPGFGRWSRKGRVWHCEPPQDLLERMLVAIVHLDDSEEASGALQLALGSHRAGLVPAPCAAAVAGARATEICRARRGDVLLLKMLSVYRSQRSKSGARRRTVRIDFTGDALPDPLSWCA